MVKAIFSNTTSFFPPEDLGGEIEKPVQEGDPPVIVGDVHVHWTIES